MLELVLGGGPVRELARDLAVEGFFEVLVDLEPATAELRQVGEHDGAVRAPDLDAQEAAGPDQLPEGPLIVRRPRCPGSWRAPEVSSGSTKPWMTVSALRGRLVVAVARTCWARSPR